MILLCLCLGFLDFYGYRPEIVITSNSRITIEKGGVFIVDCFFNGMVSSTNGGAICISTSQNIQILIGCTVFNNCSSLSMGGALSFLCNSQGEIILKQVCAYRCYTGGTELEYGGQFCYIYAASHRNNQIYDSSVTKCAFETGNSRMGSVYLSGGNQVVKSFNSSHNLLASYASYFLKGYRSLLISHSTSSSNNANRGICNWIGYGEGTGLVLYCVITQSTSQNFGLFRNNNASTIIQYSVFYQNTGILFSIPLGSLFVKDSYIDIITQIDTTISTKNITTSLFTYQFNHYHTFKCYASRVSEYPLCKQTEGKKSSIMITFLVLQFMFI